MGSVTHEHRQRKLHDEARLRRDTQACHERRASVRFSSRSPWPSGVPASGDVGSVIGSVVPSTMAGRLARSSPCSRTTTRDHLLSCRTVAQQEHPERLFDHVLVRSQGAITADHPGPQKKLVKDPRELVSRQRRILAVQNAQIRQMGEVARKPLSLRVHDGGELLGDPWKLARVAAQFARDLQQMIDVVGPKTKAAKARLAEIEPIFAAVGGTTILGVERLGKAVSVGLQTGTSPRYRNAKNTAA